MLLLVSGKSALELGTEFGELVRIDELTVIDHLIAVEPDGLLARHGALAEREVVPSPVR